MKNALFSYHKSFVFSLLLSLLSVAGWGQTTDLFFSEYVEGSSNNKYLEIYNGTGSSVNLSDYEIRLFTNGVSNPTSTLVLSGILLDGDVIVYKNNQANIYSGTATVNTTVMAYNGDDAIALWKRSTSSYVDIFGRIGNDPGTAWTGAGGYSTVDKTLRRKKTVCSGVTVNPTGAGAFTTLTTEWDIFNIDDVSGLGTHSASCSSSPNITVSPTSLSGFTYTEGNGPSTSQALTITGNNLEGDVLLDLTVLDEYFEISETATGTYSDHLENIELSPSSNVATVYVRLKSGLPIGNYEDELGIESTIQDDIYVSLSGNVTCAIPSTPNGTITPGANPACDNTTLTYVHGTGQPQDGVTYYWQTSATGTSTTNPTSSAYTVTTTGNYYVRAFNGNCWSDEALGSDEIVINLAPTITTPPTDQTATIGAIATFSVTATGATYQWYESTDSGNNWTTLTGETSNTYTTPATTLAMDGYQYRVTATNNCGEITSEDVTLHVTEGPVVKTYTLVTDVSQLEAGKKYLIVNSATAGNRQALGLQNTSNRAQSAVTVVTGSPNTITTLPASTSSGTEPFELTLGGSTGAWTLYDAVNGYNLGPALSGGNNHLKENATATYTISFNSNAAIITAVTGTNTDGRNLIRYNSANNPPLFSSYKDGQNPVYLYKEGGIASTDTYFRSQANGEWTSSSTWESSEDGITWDDATSYPGASAESVKILADHTVTLNSSSIVVTNTHVYGTLEVTTAGAYSVSGDEEIELTIENGGVFLVSSPGAFDVPGGNARGLVKTGGKIIAGSGMTESSSGTSFVNAYIGYEHGLFYFGDGAICEWANPSTTLGSNSPVDDDFFRPYEEGDMPIFRVTTTPAFPFGTSAAHGNTFNSVLEIIEPATFSLTLAGSKTFVGGVRGSGQLIMEDTSGPVIIGNSSVIPELGGTATIVTNSTNGRLRFPNGANIREDAFFTIENNADATHSFERSGGTFNIDGTLDITNQSITNASSGGISVNNGGTLRTRHTGGLFGTGSAIPLNTNNLTLGTGSTVEYYADENQSISSGKEYYHLVFSGSGTKTPQNQTDVNINGSITITGDPIVDYTKFNLGSTSENGTDFTMNGGKLIIGTGGTQPRPGGEYDITGGAIEFTGDSITDIKVSPNYHDIIISGKNKRPGGKGFKIDNILYVPADGELTIPSTPDTENPYVVNALKGVQVAAGGQLILENNANLLQDNDATNSGAITVERTPIVLDPAPTNKYLFWSSPVINQNMYDMFKDGTPQYVMSYNTEDDYYKTLGNPANAEQGKGYSVKTPESHNGVAFEGTPNNGIFTLGLNNTVNENGNTYNLVGNPYPSNMNLVTFFNKNQTEVSPTFYFWNNVSATNTNQTGAGATTWVEFNAESSTWSKINEVNSINKDTQTIRPGQGFLVSALETGTASLSFDNSLRAAGTASTMNRNVTHKDVDGKYWLELISPMQIPYSIAVTHGGDARNDFDSFDSENINSGTTFYSMIKDHKLSIQGREDFNSEDIVDIGINGDEPGTYHFHLSGTQGIFENGTSIILRDKIAGIETDLTKDDYSFNTEKGTIEGRFEITYHQDAVLDTGNPNSNQNILVYRNGEIFIIESPETIKQISVYEMSGRLVKQFNANSKHINLNIPANGTYLITLTTKDGKMYHKRVIK